MATDHIFCRDGSHGEWSYAIECRNCGDVQKPPQLPAPLDQVLAMYKAFTERHKSCQLPGAPPRQTKRIGHFCIDIDAKWSQVKKWQPRHNDGRLFTAYDWAQAVAEARAKGWEAVPTCDNPDAKGRCAGHEVEE